MNKLTYKENCQEKKGKNLIPFSGKLEIQGGCFLYVYV